MGTSGRKVRARSKKAKAEQREATRVRREQELQNANGPLDQPSSEEKSDSDHSLSDQELPVEFHHREIFSAQKRAPRPGKEQAVSAKKAGTKNGDGTYYGGGPLDLWCTACTQAGLPDEVAQGHRSNQRTFCPVLQGQPRNGPTEAAPQVSRIADEVMGMDGNGGKHLLCEPCEASHPDDILDGLLEGVIPAQKAKLMWLKAMRGASTEEKATLQSYIDNADGLVPDRKTAGKSGVFNSIGMGHGKLVKLYMVCRHHARSELHKNGGKSDHKKEMRFDVATQSVTLDINSEEPANTTAIMLLSMSHFRHAVRIKDVLSEMECYKLDVWMGMQLALSTKLLVLERATLGLLAVIDEDPAKDLVYVLDSRADNMLAREQRIYDAEQPKASPGTQKKDEKALKKPNATCCWYWSNNFDHPAKAMDQATGKCKWEDKHGVCGVPLPGGGHCAKNGRATEHSTH